MIIDAVRCFGLLKVGGVMVFDDYFWKHYPRALSNPAGAINAFLRLKKESYKVVRLYYQLVIVKIADDSYRSSTSFGAAPAE